MDYNTTLEYIDSFINFEKIPKYNYASSFKLERMRVFLQELGSPYLNNKVVHIAGSKGKGSTCAIVANILKEAGYLVGLYTSPHLVDIRERIRFLTQGQGAGDFEGMIERGEFTGLIDRIRPVAERFRDHRELGKVSFFEILTACAFLYFREKNVDFIVLETGLGGRLDATNVAMSLACGITNISMEHTDKLGNSLGSIAFEKSGIIKGDGAVFSASQPEEAIAVIRKACRERGASLCEIGKDVKYSIIYSGEDKQVFNLDGPGYSLGDLEINLIGPHQIENASLAVAMAKFIERCGFKIGDDSIRRALKDVSWPGRLEILQRGPYVIVDGAQNRASIKAALSSIKRAFNYGRLICIFGISSDKDIKGVSMELDNSSDVIILTRAENPRAENPLRLKENFCKGCIYLTNNVQEALDMALRIADEEDLLLVTGSLYIVGEAIKLMKQGKAV